MKGKTSKPEAPAKDTTPSCESLKRRSLAVVQNQNVFHSAFCILGFAFFISQIQLDAVTVGFGLNDFWFCLFSPC
jgi:hypothetical protein